MKNKQERVMTREEFEMNLLIGGWVKKEGIDALRVDTMYDHPDSVFSLGTKKGSNDVSIFQDGGYLGFLGYERAFNLVNDHMVLMQDLMNEQARVFT